MYVNNTLTKRQQIEVWEKELAEEDSDGFFETVKSHSPPDPIVVGKEYA